MKKRFLAPRRTRRQNGYALLLVIFLTMLVMLGTIVAAPATRTERQREKEEEMIWRGKQYIRGIKLYYRKNGRFPTSLEDLTKPKNGSLRFLRQAYKDPMNKEDGSWRLIYVGPSGQLIGSLKPPTTLQFGGPAGAQPGTPAAGAGLPGFGQQAQQGANPGQPGQSTTGLAPLGTTPGAPGGPGAAQSTGAGPGDSGTMSTPTSLSPSDSTSSIIGGNIIGVGSKRDKGSIIIYEKAKNYHLFEFIWDPSKDTMAIGGTGTQVGTPNAPGQGIGGPGQGFGQPAGQGPGQGFGGQGGFGTQPGNNPMQPTTPPLSTPPQQP
jgi:type II secretory pathway pseudopilin PulG